MNRPTTNRRGFIRAGLAAGVALPAGVTMARGQTPTR